MNNQLTTISNEASNIANEAMNDAGFAKMMKFKRNGDTSMYLVDGIQIELGTQRIAHCIGWTKVWIKFWDNKVAEKRIFRVARGERAPERDELPDYDVESRKRWQIGLNGQPRDPWVLQFLLPMEEPETGEINIFVASSFGGKRAVADLCQAWGTKARKNANVGQPMIRLQKTLFHTKDYGDVARPLFDLIGFTDSSGEPMREIDTQALDSAADTAGYTDMNDEIPF